MMWFRRNVKAETWLTLAVLVIGFIATNAVKAYKQEEVIATVKKQEVAIVLNTEHRLVADSRPAPATKTELIELKDDFKEALGEVRETNKAILEHLMKKK